MLYYIIFSQVFVFYRSPVELFYSSNQVIHVSVTSSVVYQYLNSLSLNSQQITLYQQSI